LKRCFFLSFENSPLAVKALIVKKENEEIQFFAEKPRKFGEISLILF